MGVARGSNHPVKDLATGRVTITSQNHGYAIDPASLAAMERAGIETIHTLTDLPQKEIISVPFTATSEKDDGREPQSKKA